MARDQICPKTLGPAPWSSWGSPSPEPRQVVSNKGSPPAGRAQPCPPEQQHGMIASLSRSSRSAGERASDYQVLPLPGQARRLGVGAELRHHRAQQQIFAAPLHRQR